MRHTRTQETARRTTPEIDQQRVGPTYGPWFSGWSSWSLQWALSPGCWCFRLHSGRTYPGYFGLGGGVLRFSLQDYLLHSADGTFGTAVRVLVLVIGLVLLERLLAWRINQSVARVVWPPIVALGVVLFGVGLLASLGLTMRLPAQVAAITLAVGAVLVFRVGPTMIKQSAGPSTDPASAAAQLRACLNLGLEALSAVPHGLHRRAWAVAG